MRREPSGLHCKTVTALPEWTSRSSFVAPEPEASVQIERVPSAHAIASTALLGHHEIVTTSEKGYLLTVRDSRQSPCALGARGGKQGAGLSGRAKTASRRALRPRASTHRPRAQV